MRFISSRSKLLTYAVCAEVDMALTTSRERIRDLQDINV